MYYSFVVSPTGLSAFNETDNESIPEINFPPVWIYNETVFRINKNAELVLDLNQYFSDQDNDALSYLATQPSSFTVVLEGSVLKAKPEQNFFGERTITVTVSDEINIVNQDILVIVEETSASFNAGASIQDKDNKFVGKKVIDETSFETYFNYIVKNETGLFLSFYHDSIAPQRIWIEGNVTYELSQNLSLANENITLAVFRDNGVVPKFKLHIGETSEVFEFGKEIPEVIIEDAVGSPAAFTFIDRDDELLDVEVTQENAKAVIKGINVSEIAVKAGQSDELILSTDVFAAEPIEMESAEIALPKTGNVNAIMECADFDLESFSCNGSWINSGLSFTQNDTHIFFTVNHFSGYGGADIDVLTVQSYPMVGSIWTVEFNVSGTANLTITAEDGTNFGTDLIFLSLSCGDTVVPASYDGTKVFYENFNCASLAYEKSTVLSRGKHTLKFLFGDEEDYAFNEAYSGAYNLSTANFSVYGENPSDNFGYSMATGDFNGDGIKDLLAGAPNYGESDIGKAYVFLGPFPTNNAALNASQANWSWYGANASDKAGFSVAAGDVDNDGYDDMIIGAPYYDGTADPLGVDFGAVYLIYGAVSVASYNLSKVPDAVGRAVFVGQGLSDYAGWSLASGLLSNTGGLPDAIDDFVAGAPNWQAADATRPGKVYTVFGAAGRFSGWNYLATANASFIGVGDADQFGFDVAVGDVTADSKPDLLVSAPFRVSAAGAESVGYVYIINGSLSNEMNDSENLVTGHINGSYYGEGPTSHLGYSLDAGGDVNNDSITDFIAGAYLDDKTIANRGAAYLVYGRTKYSVETNISVVANASWLGQAGNDELGYTVAIGNLLNDSYADVFVSSYNQSSIGGRLAGRFYVIYGQNVTETLGQNISVAADASWYAQFQGSGGPMASGSLWVGSWSEAYQMLPGLPLVSEPGRGYYISGMNPVHALTPAPTPTGGGTGGGGGGGGGGPTPGICVRQPIKFSTEPPIYPGTTIDVTITTGVTQGTFLVPSFGLAIVLNPWEATMVGDMYSWNFPMEVPTIASAGIHQAVLTNPSGTSCGDPLQFTVTPLLCSLPAPQLSEVGWGDTDYKNNFGFAYVNEKEGAVHFIGSQKLIPAGNAIGRDIINMPSKITLAYCDGQQTAYADVPLDYFDSYFGDLVSINFMVAKYRTEAGLLTLGSGYGNAISPAAVASITGAVAGVKEHTPFEGFSEHVFSYCVNKNEDGDPVISSGSRAAGSEKDCPSGQVEHWCDYECVPEEVSAADDARLQEIIAQARASSSQMPEVPSEAQVPQVFGGGTGTTLFEGIAELPKTAFDHPIGVKIEYPKTAKMTLVSGSEGIVVDRPLMAGTPAEGAASSGERYGVPEDYVMPPAPSVPEGRPPTRMSQEQQMWQGMYESKIASFMPQPAVGGRVQQLGQQAMEQARKAVAGGVVAGSDVNAVYDYNPKRNSITGMVGTAPANAKTPTTATVGMPPGFKPVNKQGSENPANVPPPCTPPTVPQPPPGPGTSPTPVITHGGTTTTVSIGPANVETPGRTISSIGTATGTGVTLTFPMSAEIAVQQREIGTGLWGSLYGGIYANTWMNAPNIELPTGGSTSTGGGISTAPQQPSTPSGEPSAQPPEPETPAPSEGPAELPTAGSSGESEGGAQKLPESQGEISSIPGSEPVIPQSEEPTEPVSTPAEGPAVTSPTPAPLPVAGSSGGSEGSGQAFPGTAAVISIHPNNSFWSWLRGLFTY